MHEITLICSVHRENGLCNAAELIKLLRTIEPETVFEEIRPSDFDLYCRHGTSLEARAIARYHELKSCRRVPVDRYDMPNNLIAETKRKFDRVFDYVEQASREYRLLTEENDKSVHRHGFDYLNSTAFSTMSDRIAEIEQKTIIETGDQELIRGLETWRQLMQRRDFEMVVNIYEFCRENVFGAGVFVIGAAHKSGIIKEIEKHATMEAAHIDWKLFP